MLLIFALLFVGFLILTLGAELLVRGSSTLGLKLGISPLIIGLTVVAFGTSAPELAVSLDSALTGRSSIALGNVIGSNIANIGLILGIVAILCPVSIDQELVKKQIPLLIGVSILMWLLLLDNELGVIDGVFLVAGLAGFLLVSYLQSARDKVAAELLMVSPIVGEPGKPTTYFIGMIILGLAMLVYGAHLFVESAVDMALLLGISEAVIGLSVVAVGTSIPELATSLVAAWKKESALAVGNIIGSNLFNILGILGITAIIQPIYGGDFHVLDFLVMLAFAVVLLPFTWKSLQINRLQGCMLLSGYAGYMVYIFGK
ncbi:MAG: calcium/sodium antiporter [Pseudohongiellaceae bacterium]